ncbi:hypothetical protein RQP46_002053 [Phenoliferia psychrophenolica]
MSAKIKALFSSSKSEVAAPAPTAPASESDLVFSPTATLAETDVTSTHNKEGSNIEKQPSSSVGVDEVDGLVYPTGIKLKLILMSMLLVNFLVALDQTIVAAAVPVIANDFRALSDVGWYGSAYLLTGTALQPLFGKAFWFFSKKWLFIGCLVTFEVGSIICAAAQSSKVFIVGRAIAGIGFGGLYIGILAIVATVLPVSRQALFTSVIGACYGLGATIGPVIGGTFTSKVTWRWCFWINVPIGGVALVIAIVFLNPAEKKQELSVMQRLARMDWIGTTFLLGSIISLLLALQDGGVVSAWNSPKQKGLLVAFGLLFVMFFITQYFMKENASINLRVLRQRSIFLACLMNLTIGSVYFALLYYVPIYFQAVRGSTPIHSGVQALALIGSAIASVIVSGGLVEAFKGRFNPEMYFGTICASIGCGLLSMLTPSTSTGKWVGYQLLAGGIGAAFMLPYIASQIILPAADRPAGATATIFFQTLGATIFVSVANAIYQNKFLEYIQAIPGLDVGAVVASGVSSFREIVPEALLPAVILAANTVSLSNPPSDVLVAIAHTVVTFQAVSKVFLGLTMLSIFGFLCSTGIEWATIKEGDEVNLGGGGA